MTHGSADHPTQASALFPHSVNTGRPPGAPATWTFSISGQPHETEKDAHDDGGAGGGTNTWYYMPEAVLTLWIIIHVIIAQEASTLPPQLQQQGDAMKQKPGPALFGSPNGLSAGRGTMGLLGSQIAWDHFSKWHFPRCRVRPSDSKT